MSLGALKNTKGLVLPEVIGSYLYIDYDTDVKDLTLPKEIGGDLIIESTNNEADIDLSNCTVGGSVVLGSIIGKNVCFEENSSIIKR